MNKQDFDVLVYVNDCSQIDFEEAGRILFKSDIEIESAYRTLVEEGFVDGSTLTDLGKNYLQTHKVDNAIILAAGMSTRFVPLNFEKPKGLLEINGEPLIERQIKQLREKRIQEGTVRLFSGQIWGHFSSHL